MLPSSLKVSIFLFTSSWLFGQSNLKNLQEVQFLSQNQCVVIQVNADWNARAAIGDRVPSRGQRDMTIGDRVPSRGGVSWNPMGS